mgnify:CR=1 FL=1
MRRTSVLYTWAWVLVGLAIAHLFDGELWISAFDFAAAFALLIWDGVRLGIEQREAEEREREDQSDLYGP